MKRAIISKPIDKVRDTDWPAECWLCDLALASSEEARLHREQTECEDTGAHEQVLVLQTDRDVELDAIRKADGEWKQMLRLFGSVRYGTGS